MITANQLRAARALLNIDQRQMAELADLSVPTIQRMEASDGVIRANVDLLMKLVSALDNAGIELINPGAPSLTGGSKGAPSRTCHKSQNKSQDKEQDQSANRSGCWSGFDSVPHDVTAPASARSSSASNPFSMAVGVGGQPGMCRSTGTTSETPPTTA